MEKHFDLKAFYASLDAQREAKRLSWRQVAEETGVNASTLTRIGQGKSPDVGNFLALVNWLGIDASAFFDLRDKKEPGTLATISLALQNDTRLSDEGKNIIDDMVRSTYLRLCKQ